jgi:hypothetical protein
MDMSVLGNVKKRLVADEDKNLVEYFTNTLNIVKLHADKILIKSKSIEALELKDGIMKEAIITAANNNKELEDKLTFFVKFLSRNTYSCIPIKELNKDSFVRLREYLKKNSGIQAIPKEERLAKQTKTDSMPQPYGKANKSGNEKK